MNMRKAGWTAVGVLTIFAIVFAHEGHKAITTKGVTFGPKSGNLLMEPLARKAIGLSTAKVDFGTIEETLRVPARVVLPLDRQGFASTRIAGIVESIKVKPGDFVKEGDVLAEVTSLELESLQLEFANRLLERRLVEKNLARARELGERIVAGKEFLELETELQDKSNEISIVRRKLEAVGLRKDEIEKLAEKGETVKTLPILAPLAGSVAHIDIQIGLAVEPTKHLFEIHDPALVWVQGEVPESRISAVSDGLIVKVNFPAYPEREWSGKVERTGQAVSEDSRTIPVWASISNPDSALKPGLIGQMKVVIGVSENVTVAPVQAIIEDGAEKYAIVQEKVDTYFRFDAKEKIEEYASEKKEGFTFANGYIRKNVVVGRSDGRVVEIVEGLYPGDIVVAEATHEISALYVQGTLKLSDEARKNIRLATEEVDLRPVDEIVRLNATLQVPVGQTALASSAIEGKILKVHVVPGQEVKAGDVLAEVHSFDLENLQLESFRASLRERLLGTRLAQIRSLGEITPRKDLLRIETDHGSQLSTAMSLRRRLQLLRISDTLLDRLATSGETLPALPIRAPISGRVVEVDAVVGQVIKPEDHLFQIMDHRVLWAEAKAFERDFGSILQGDPLKEILLRVGGREIRTKLSFVSQSMGYHERILPMYAQIANEDGALLPGMIGEIAVVVGRPEKKVIAAPVRAIYSVGGQTFAFVAEGKTFKRVPVELGRQDAEFVEVVRGLFPGDKVAVSGVNELNTAINSLK